MSAEGFKPCGVILVIKKGKRPRAQDSMAARIGEDPLFVRGRRSGLSIFRRLKGDCYEEKKDQALQKTVGGVHRDTALEQECQESPLRLEVADIKRRAGTRATR
jgi:hypothetical protein